MLRKRALLRLGVSEWFDELTPLQHRQTVYGPLGQRFWTVNQTISLATLTNIFKRTRKRFCSSSLVTPFVEI